MPSEITLNTHDLLQALQALGFLLLIAGAIIGRWNR